MKSILFLALFLYNIICLVTGSYDYDDHNRKRHSIDERKYVRQKALEKPQDGHTDNLDTRASGPDHWEEEKNKYPASYNVMRERYDEREHIDRDHNDGAYNDVNRNPDYEHQAYRGAPSHYEERDPVARKRLEPPEGYIPPQHSTYVDKEPTRKMTMNCDRPHERYEPCFSGCASVTCDNPRDRLRPCYPFCESGCVCVHPYVRDDRTHKCVMPNECTKGLKGIPDLTNDT